MRVFFALPLEESLKLEIDQWRQKNMPPSLNHVPIVNFHVTLAFIGKIRDSDLDTLCQRTDEMLDQNEFYTGSFDITETGYWAKPGILWIGPKHWPESLNNLSMKLSNVGRNFGAKKDRKTYRPHVTLSKRCMTPCYPTKEAHFHMTYQQIGLYHSVPVGNGVRYEEVQSWPLTTRPQVHV